MSLNNLGLGFVFTAQDLASGTIDKLKGSFGELEGKSKSSVKAFESQLGSFGTGLALMGAGIAGLAGLSVATQAAGEFSAAITEITTLVDESTFAVDDMRKTTLDMAAQFGGTATDQAKGLYQAISAGVTNAADATELLTTANKLAVGGATNVTVAIDGLTNVVNAFSASGVKSTDVADAMFVAIRDGKTTAEELSASLGGVAPTAASLGVAFDDLLAATGAVTIQGIKTSEAVTGLKAAFANIMRPTGDAAKEAARLGIQFNAASLRAKGLPGFLDAITHSAGYNQDSMSKLFGSTEAVNAVMALTANESKGFNMVLDHMKTRAGSTQSAFDKMSQTLTFQQKRFEGLKSNALVLIGSALEPLAASLVGIVNAVLEGFAKIPAPIRNFFVKFAAGAAVVLTVVGAFIAAKAAIALFLIGLKAVGLSVGGLLASVLPAIVVIGLLAAAAYGFYYAFTHNIGGIGDYVRNLFERVSLVFKGIGQLFEQGGFSGAIKDELDKAENGGLKNFVISVYLWVNRIKNFFSSIADGFSAGIEAAKPAIDAFKNALTQLGKAFGGLGEEQNAATNSSKFEAFGQAGAKVGTVLAKVFEYVVKALTALVEVGQGVAQVWDVIKAGAEVIVNAFSQLGDKIGEVINSFSAQDAATQQTGSFWQGLGNVIGVVVGIIESVIGVLVAVISTAVGLIGAAIHAVMDVFAGLADLVTGVVFIIGGIFSGSWSDIWTGMKLVAFGVVEAIIGVVLELVGAVAGAADAVAGLFGKSTSYQKSIQDFKKGVLDDMSKGMGLENVAFNKPASATPANAPIATPTQGPLMSAMPAASDTHALASMMSTMQSTMAQQKAAPPPPPPPVNVIIDGEVVARASANASTESANRSFSPLASY